MCIFSSSISKLVVVPTQNTNKFIFLDSILSILSVLTKKLNGHQYAILIYAILIYAILIYFD